MMSAIVLFPVAQRLARRSPVAVLIPEDISATAVPPTNIPRKKAQAGPQTEALKKKVFADSVIRMADSTRRRQSRKVGEVAMDHLHLCGDILSETVEQQGKDTAYYDDLISRAAAPASSMTR
jgi:hypothetical protein